MKLQRNNKCPCGSGKKYKKCCYLDAGKVFEINKACKEINDWDELVEYLAKPEQIYTLKVTLVSMSFDDMDEEISRTFEVSGKDNFYEFHYEIQKAFNWDNDHMFSFFIGEEEYSANPLGEHLVRRMGRQSKPAGESWVKDIGLTENSKFRYLFDYGDELQHDIVVENIRDINSDDNSSFFPLLIDSIGEAPEQY